jgi:hypothetical protein
MLANDVYHRHLGTMGVVKIGEAVGKTGAEMKETACGFPSHSCKSVCGAGDDTFEETEHATHFCHSV